MKVSVGAAFKFDVWWCEDRWPFDMDVGKPPRWVANIMLCAEGAEPAVLLCVNKEQAANMKLFKIVAAIEEKEAQDGLL